MTPDKDVWSSQHTLWPAVPRKCWDSVDVTGRITGNCGDSRPVWRRSL